MKSSLAEELARMEAEGSLHSATNDELFAVAGEFCQRIIEAFHPKASERILIKGTRVGKAGKEVTFLYAIERKELLDNRAARWLIGGHRVLANRDTVRAFLMDIHNGLLDTVAECVKIRNEESMRIIALIKGRI